jgi:hypothetical protein
MKSFLTLLMLVAFIAIDASAQRTTTELGGRPAPIVARIPNPALTWYGLDVNAKGSDGKPYIRVNLGITNYNEFPDLLLARSPELPACGQNQSAARSWLHIVDAKTKKEIYSYCAMSSRFELRTFSFNVERAELPSQVYVELEDRAGKKSYQSNCLKTSDGKPCETNIVVGTPMLVAPAVTPEVAFQIVYGRDPNSLEAKFWQAEILNGKLTQDALNQRLLEHLTKNPDVYSIGEMKFIVQRAFQKAQKGWPADKDFDYWTNRIMAHTAYYKIILDTLKQ